MQTRTRGGQRRRWREGQAGGCKAEVPQETIRQPVGANERQMGGGVLEQPVQGKAAARQEAAVLTRGWEAEAVQQDATQQSAGENEGGRSRMGT